MCIHIILEGSKTPYCVDRPGAFVLDCMRIVDPKTRTISSPSLHPSTHLSVGEGVHT